MTSQPIDQEILLFFAVAEESTPLLKRLHSEGWLKKREKNSILLTRDNKTLRIVHTGMGKAQTLLACQQYLNNTPPKLVITSGFAGALNPNLTAGQVIAQANTPFVENFPTITQTLPLSSIHCSSTIVRTSAEKARLYASTQCDAVEMESGLIQETCTARDIPCLTLRAVSDTAKDDLPLDFSALTGSDGTVRIPKLLLELAKKPGKIPALVRLGSHSTLAAKKIANEIGNLFKNYLQL